MHPHVGDVVMVAAAPELAGMPARVVAIWPRMRSGEYLVTLEYNKLVKLGKDWLTHIDVFVSELEVLSARERDQGA